MPKKVGVPLVSPFFTSPFPPPRTKKRLVRAGLLAVATGAGVLSPLCRLRRAISLPSRERQQGERRLST
jgi:hypothetical protein